MFVDTEDKLLWRDIASGDHRAFSELYDRYWASFFQYTYKILQSREETEELVQELFIQLWNKREELPELQSVQAYLFTMLKNRVLNCLAKKKVRQLSLDRMQEEPGAFAGTYAMMDTGVEDAAEALERKSSEGVIRHMAAGLPARMQEVYMLHQFSGMSIAEIAVATGNSEQTIRNQFNTALKKLSVLYRNNLQHFFFFFLIFSGYEWLSLF